MEFFAGIGATVVICLSIAYCLFPIFITGALGGKCSLSEWLEWMMIPALVVFCIWLFVSGFAKFGSFIISTTR